jgi:hypothetical protein
MVALAILRMESLTLSETQAVIPVRSLQVLVNLYEYAVVPILYYFCHIINSFHHHLVSRLNHRLGIGREHETIYYAESAVALFHKDSFHNVPSNTEAR